MEKKQTQKNTFYLYKTPKYVKTKLYCLRIHTEIVKEHFFKKRSDCHKNQNRVSSGEKKEVVTRKGNVWGRCFWRAGNVLLLDLSGAHYRYL